MNNKIKHKQLKVTGTEALEVPTLVDIGGFPGGPVKDMEELYSKVTGNASKTGYTTAVAAIKRGATHDQTFTDEAKNL